MATDIMADSPLKYVPLSTRPWPRHALSSREKLQNHCPDPFTPQQWSIFMAFADTFFPSVRPVARENEIPNDKTTCTISQDDYQRVRNDIMKHADQSGFNTVAELESHVDRFLAEKPSDNNEIKSAIWYVLTKQMSIKMVNEVRALLNILGSRFGTIAVCGVFTPFLEMSYHQRRDVLIGWSSSRLSFFRKIPTSLRSLFGAAYFSTSPFYAPILGAPAMPAHEAPVPGFDFSFYTPPDTETSLLKQLDADVVIVGSGCGGAIAAANLSATGLRVIVIEKGHCWKHEDFPLRGQYGSAQLFENGGVVLSDEGTLGVIAGATWGGGGTVNWSASLKTEGRVREEWAKQSGVPWFDSAAFQASLDRVCERMGVSAEHTNHSHTNRVLLDGAEKLGWAHKAVPQNTDGKVHYCGSCTFGCHTGGKNGTMESWLPDAARNGAIFIQGMQVTEVLFDRKSSKMPKARGVRGIWLPRGATPDQPGQEITISARRVIVSGGSLQSPLLLMRSGVKNWHLGRHLKTHPVSIVHALFDYETRPWEGAILTSIVSEFDNQDGKGHGVKLEGVNINPEMMTQILPSPRTENPGLTLKELAVKTRYMGSWVVMARDIGEGRVFPDPSEPNRMRISYPINSIDQKHIAVGMAGLVKLLHASGARAIYSTITNTPVWERQGEMPAHARLSERMRQQPYPEPDNLQKEPKKPEEGDLISTTSSETDNIKTAALTHTTTPSSQDFTADPTLNEFISELRTRAISADGDTTYMSAHQMGTCRMASQSGDGVVDGSGKVWGYNGLYVMDASVFPSASGVNPMVSVMAIVDLLSRRMGETLLAEIAEVEEYRPRSRM